MGKITAGSRESKLAVVQTEMVTDYIRQNYPQYEVNILTMKTTGDRILDRKLDDIGGKGLFVKELDIALREKRTDFSVHSLKDLPMEVPDDLPVIGYSVREDPRDALILPKGTSGTKITGPIGCSGSRRALQLKKLYPQVEIRNIRGNVQTRLRKLDEGEYGAIVLAAAGLKRLGLEDRISRIFSPDEMIPAAGQGILCIQGRRGENYDYLDGFLDRDAAECAAAERAFTAYLNGGCSSPVAAYAEIDGENLFVRGLYYEEETHRTVVGSITGPRKKAAAVGRQLAAQLRCAGVRKEYASCAVRTPRGECEAKDASYSITGVTKEHGSCAVCIPNDGHEAKRDPDTPVCAGTRISGGGHEAKDASCPTSRTEIRDTVFYREGRVWLVGAGPGDFGLFTQKGESVLAEAEVVVYDSLVGQEVLSRMPAGAEKIDAGKRAGNHHKSQWQTNEILAEEALKGKRVVRLKGGDPFLFGRGGEELELLTKYGIPYEVVPGVTSAISVPAYNGIPVTHRDFASSVHIITGHRRAGVGYDINFRALAEAGGTYVFLMGLAALGDLMRGLLDGGISPDMPAAVLQQGATSHQRKVFATVATIEAEAAKAHLEAPAVIVVGEVCALAQDFSWYEHLPLFGEKIVVTRPRRRSAALTEELKKLGAEVVSAPVIRTVPVTDQGKLEDMEKAFREIGKYTMLVFTSPYGVERFTELCREKRMDLRTLAGKRLAAIGRATAEALERRGMFVDIIPEQYESAELGKAIRRACRPGEYILIPRSAGGSEALVDEILREDGVQAAGGVPGQSGAQDEAVCETGIRVHDLPIYDTVCDAGTADFLRGEMESGDVTVVTFTSASTVRAFTAMLPDYDYRNITAVCIGKQTEAAAASCGMKTMTAKNATVEDMVHCILSYHKKNFSD